MGISEQRLKMGFCSAAEGQKFQREATEFDKLIRELGPSPLRSKGNTPKKKANA
jgi:coenzyme F420-reducing hydrogenase delta subunit